MQLIQQHHQEHQQQLGDGLTLRVVSREMGASDRVWHIPVLAHDQNPAICILPEKCVDVSTADAIIMRHHLNGYTCPLVPCRARSNAAAATCLA
jgi:hypothetical protein